MVLELVILVVVLAIVLVLVVKAATAPQADGVYTIERGLDTLGRFGRFTRTGRAKVFYNEHAAKVAAARFGGRRVKHY